MMKKYLMDIVNYNNEVDHSVIEWIQQIDEAQWKKEIASSFNSIEKTTIHIVSAKRIWVDFWKKTPNPAFLSATFKGSKSELIEVWKEAMNDYQKIMENYPEENYEQIISFRFGSKEWKMEFAQTVLHHNNHATYHRGQLVTMLRNVGFTNLSNTDLITYFVNNG